MTQMDPKKMTKTERIHWSFGMDAMLAAEQELLATLQLRGGLPPEWDEIALDSDRRDAKRMRVTVSMDADVVKFFRGLGPGYGPRMNRVLRGYMHFRLAKVLNGPDTTDFVMRPEEVLKRARRKHEWGDVAKMVGEDPFEGEGGA